MAVMIWQGQSMEKLIRKLSSDFPYINFVSGEGFCWSPQTKTVIYNIESGRKNANWTLLHEVAHAKLGHKTYSSDVQLLRIEVDAWQEACRLAKLYGINVEINDDHIQNCLDSYRNWLHQRSTCPTCDNHCLQIDSSHYRCFNCHTIWKVTTSRFCRPYRIAETKIGTPTAAKPQVMFL